MRNNAVATPPFRNRLASNDQVSVKMTKRGGSRSPPSYFFSSDIVRCNCSLHGNHRFIITFGSTLCEDLDILVATVMPSPFFVTEQFDCDLISSV